MTNETRSIRLPSLRLDREAIAKRLRVPDNSRKREELNEMIDTIESLAAPALHIRAVEPGLDEEGSVILAGERVESEKLRRLLQKKARKPEEKPVVYAFAATYGQEASDWGNSREYGLPVFWAQTILEEGMLMLLDLLETELKKDGDFEVSVIEPGVPEDWPLTQQDSVFRVLGGSFQDFGITPNEQSLMLPFRYVAGLAYFSDSILPQCGVCHFTDCNKQRGGCWRLQAIKRKSAASQNA